MLAKYIELSKVGEKPDGTNIYGVFSDNQKIFDKMNLMKFNKFKIPKYSLASGLIFGLFATKYWIDYIDCINNGAEDPSTLLFVATTTTALSLTSILWAIYDIYSQIKEDKEIDKMIANEMKKFEGIK